MASFAADIYQEDDTAEWIAFFKMNSKRDDIQKVLEEIGVDDDLTDAKSIYTTLRLLEQVFNKVSKITFFKFVVAPQKTLLFRGENFATEAWADAILKGKDAAEWEVLLAALAASSGPQGSSGTASAAVKSSSEAALEKELEDLKRQRERLLPSEVSAGTSAVESSESALEKEIAAMRREIELMSTTKSTSKKAKETDRERELRKELEDLKSKVITRTSTKKKEKLDEAEREEALAKKVKETIKKKELIKDLDEKLREAASLDLCFLLDCTGSMSGHISSMKENINNLVGDISKVYPDIPLRLAFVGYRDHCDGANRLAVEHFAMNNTREFRDKVAAQTASGGGDGPEDVFGALNVASSMDWSSATRILYHIADAPCHGTRFHSGMGDDYPAGDPHGLLAENLLPALRDKNITYYFGRINNYTDKMITEFNAIMGDEFVKSTDCKTAASLMTTVSKSVTTTLTASISSSATTTERYEKREILLAPSEPNWATLKVERVNKYTMRHYTSVKELVESDDSSSVEKIPEIANMKIAPLPFAHGACRLATKAQEIVGSSKRDKVHKVTLSSNPRHQTRQEYEKGSISTHCAACFLSTEFEKVKPSGAPVISFIEIELLNYLERGDTPYCTQEQALTGTWVKYNNNSGMVNRMEDIPNHDIIQAFSHWTYENTGGNIMIVDIQGVYDESSNTFTLSDPAVHCKDVTRFGGTNLGKDGFKRFFKTHTCNGICSHLGLTMPTF